MSDVKEQIQQFSSKAEDLLDTIGQPLKPYIPAISRFLIVATFLEDSLRELSLNGVIKSSICKTTEAFSGVLVICFWLSTLW
jgi:hypothetical protein